MALVFPASFSHSSAQQRHAQSAGKERASSISRVNFEIILDNGYGAYSANMHRNNVRQLEQHETKVRDTLC